MIKVFDDYVIRVGEMDYILSKDMHRVDKKKGTPVFKNLGYYNSIRGALRGLYRLRGRELLADQVISLNEAISILDSVNKEFEEALGIAFEEV